MIASLFRRLFGHGPPSRREMMALQDSCDGLEARVEQHYAELKALRGKVNSMRRWEAEAEGDGLKPATASPTPKPSVGPRSMRGF